MNYLRILCVQIIKRVEQLIAPGQHLIRRKRALLVRHHLGQIVAGNVLHHQKLAIAFAEVIAYARQGRMMHAREQTRFALKLLRNRSSANSVSFSATVVSRRSSIASYTAPMPPWPSWLDHTIAVLQN